MSRRQVRCALLPSEPSPRRPADQRAIREQALIFLVLQQQTACSQDCSRFARGQRAGDRGNTRQARFREARRATTASSRRRTPLLSSPRPKSRAELKKRVADLVLILAPSALSHPAKRHHPSLIFFNALRYAATISSSHPARYAPLRAFKRATAILSVHSQQ